MRRSHLKSSDVCSRPVSRRNLENLSKKTSKFCPLNLGKWSSDGSRGGWSGCRGRGESGKAAAGCGCEVMACTFCLNDGDSVDGSNGLNSPLLRSSF